MKKVIVDTNKEVRVRVCRCAKSTARVVCYISSRYTEDRCQKRLVALIPRLTGKRSRTGNSKKAKAKGRFLPMFTGGDPPLPDSVFALNLQGPQDLLKLYGMPWALERGYAHLLACSKKDADIILETLGISPLDTPEKHNTAYAQLVEWELPWRWLQLFDEAGGDFRQLSIKKRY